MSLNFRGGCPQIPFAIKLQQNVRSIRNFTSTIFPIFAATRGYFVFFILLNLQFSKIFNIFSLTFKQTHVRISVIMSLDVTAKHNKSIQYNFRDFKQKGAHNSHTKCRKCNEIKPRLLDEQKAPDVSTKINMDDFPPLGSRKLHESDGISKKNVKANQKKSSDDEKLGSFEADCSAKLSQFKAIANEIRTNPMNIENSMADTEKGINACGALVPNYNDISLGVDLAQANEHMLVLLFHPLAGILSAMASLISNKDIPVDLIEGLMSKYWRICESCVKLPNKIGDTKMCSDAKNIIGKEIKSLIKACTERAYTIAREIHTANVCMAKAELFCVMKLLRVAFNMSHLVDDGDREYDLEPIVDTIFEAMSKMPILLGIRANVKNAKFEYSIVYDEFVDLLDEIDEKEEADKVRKIKLENLGD
jgi:hypothetical protein